MNILLIGSGGREHAIAKKLYESPDTKKIFCTPGNPGTEKYAVSVVLNTSNHNEILSYCKNNEINLVVIGPEIPLVEGLVDFLNKYNILVFGPKKLAAKLEGSKKFTKEICEKYNIPTAKYKSFNEENLAIDYLKTQNFPIVIKADGLAAGKGVIIAENLNEGIDAIKKIFSGIFDKAGNKIIIEEFLIGEEVSFFILADENNFIELTSAQDHKRIGLNDTGPNTGGMGAYSPAPIVDKEIHEKIMQEVINPTLKGLKDDGHEYVGFLYAGMMIDHYKNIKVLEFNCRFGDPETQPIMMRLKSDLTELCHKACDGKLKNETLQWETKKSLGVVIAAKGYPFEYDKGEKISNIPKEKPDLKVFHAGTKFSNGNLMSNGGRVLCVTALGSTVQSAQKKAYNAINDIEYENSFYRKDIGHRAIKRELK